MQKRLLIVLLLGLAILFTAGRLQAAVVNLPGNQAQRPPIITGPYVGLGGGSYEYDGLSWDGRELDAQPELGKGKLGYQFNSVFAGEFHMGLGGTDEAYYDFNEYPIEVQYVQNVFLKLQYPSYVIPYILVGLSHGILEYRDPYGKYSESFFDCSFGAGVKYPLRSDHRWSIYMEGIKIAEDVLTETQIQEDDLDSISIGLTFGF